MKVLYVSSEVSPFIKTGGLADVAGSLPKTLKKDGVDIRVCMPLYENIPHNFRQRMKFIKSVYISLSWRNLYCGIYELEHNGVTHYFIDNEYYFNRSEIYGHFDDGERFAFFSKAVIDIMSELDFKPDIIHCNDWQTALIPVYLRLIYGGSAYHADIKTVLTIHNLQYQGRYGREILGDVFGISEEFFYNGFLAFGDGISLLKGAILCADHITTVSPSYANEIQTPYFGYGLDAVLRSNLGKLTGIINGIDEEWFNPKTDPHLFQNYDLNTREDKQYNKDELLRILGIKAADDIPVIAIISRLVGHKGIDLIAHCLDEIMAEDLRLVVLGMGEWRYEQMFEQLKYRYPGKASINVMFSDDLANKIYAGADIIIMPSRSEPCGIAQMIAMHYGTIPIVREVGGLKDTVKPFDRETGEGNGFVFANYNAHDMLHVIRQTVEFYKDKAGWDKLMINAMTSDFSWKQSARELKDVYKKVCGC